MTIIAFEPEDYTKLSDLVRQLINRETVFTFDEQRDYAEKLRLALCASQAVVLMEEQHENEEAKRTGA